MATIFELPGRLRGILSGGKFPVVAVGKLLELQVAISRDWRQARKNRAIATDFCNAAD